MGAFEAIRRNGADTVNIADVRRAQRSVRSTLLATMLFIALPVALLPALRVHRMAAIGALAVWGVSCGAMPVALQMWMAQATPQMREGGMALFVANFQISIALGRSLLICDTSLKQSHKAGPSGRAKLVPALPALRAPLAQLLACCLRDQMSILADSCSAHWADCANRSPASIQITQFSISMRNSTGTALRPMVHTP